ncbi:MAG: DUF4337 domain-containing protein [Xanthobacteraceae bacterium]
MKHDGEHGGGGHKELLDSRNKKVALLIAILALFLAFSETLGKSAQTAALSYNVEASNLWAFFQAKTIRQTVLQAATEILKIDLIRGDGEQSAAAAKAALAKRIDSWEKASARYNTEPMERPVRKEVNLNPPYGEGRRELMALAMAAEKKRDIAMERYHHYEVASAAFQIGIVLASATVITGMVALSWLAGVLGLAGIAFTAIGFFAPHAVHLF